MVSRKPVPDSQRDDPHQKELELLYARRSAIDTLIRSLTEYDRLRLPEVEAFEEKTA
jgi:hypothetical protein